MREIKFRAWDKKEKIMWLPNEDTFCGRLLIQLNGDLFSRCGNDLIKLNRDEFIIMQYTGLTDKNGKDIYEGDIVKTDDIWDFRYAKVGFVNGCFSCVGYMFDDSFTELRMFYDIDGCELEVISSIYENPELLRSNQ